MIVASIWANHPLHGEARDWLAKSRAHDLAAAVCQHSLLEAYASLTGMPSRPKLAPAAVHAALTEATSTLEIVSLGEDDYRTCLKRADTLGLAGGICYDLLLLVAAEKSEADGLITANPKDFLRLWQGDRGFIVSL